MVEQKDNRVPKIRFKGFTGAWEEKTLGGLGIVAMNKRIFKHQTSPRGDIPFFKIGTFGKEPDSFISRELFQKYKERYPYPEKGDLLISASGSIGKIVEYKGKDEYFQDSNIVWLDHNDEVLNPFLKQYYLVIKWAGIEGTTIKRLYNKNILDTKIHLPSPEEQSQIGNYFETLDRLIKHHQLKYEKLLALKKAMLQKMFPVEGSAIPEIRFKDFKEPWQEKSLGDTGDFNPKSDLPDIFEYVDLESVRGTQMIAHRTETKCSAPSRAQRLAQHGDLFYQMVRPYQKNNHLFTKSDANYVFSTGYAQIRPKEDSYFLLCLVQGKEFVKIVLDNCTGTSYPAINSNDLAKIAVRIPELKEQQKIGALFRQIDELVIEHQAQMVKLRQLKLACLQKMFI